MNSIKERMKTKNRSYAFFLFSDFGKFLKTLKDANLTFDGDLKEVLAFIDRMMEGAETNCTFEEREGLELAENVLETWNEELERLEESK